MFGCSPVKSLRELSSRCQVVPLGAKTALQGFTFPPCLFLFYYFQFSPQKLKKGCVHTCFSFVSFVLCRKTRRFQDFLEIFLTLISRKMGNQLEITQYKYLSFKGEDGGQKYKGIVTPVWPNLLELLIFIRSN